MSSRKNEHRALISGASSIELRSSNPAIASEAPLMALNGASDSGAHSTNPTVIAKDRKGDGSLGALATRQASEERQNINLCLDLGPVLLGELVSAYAKDTSSRSSSRSTRLSLPSRARAILALPVASKAARDVTRADLAAMLLSLADRPRTANNLLGMIGSAYRWGQVTGMVTEERDPTRGVKRIRAPKAARIIPLGSIAALIYAMDLAELAGADPQWIDFARIIAATGLRVGDLRKMRKANVDLAGRSMALTQKGDRPLAVVIPRAASHWLERVLERTRGPWLFPSSKDTSRHAGNDQPATKWNTVVIPVAQDLRATRQGIPATVADVASKIGRPARQIEEWEEHPPDLQDLRGRRITLAHWRATNITAKVSAGSTLKTAGMSVGHASQATTERAYLGPLFNSDQLDEASEAMDDFFSSCSEEPAIDHRISVRVARKIKERREQLCLSKTEAARRLGIVYRTWHKYEQSFTTLGKIEQVAKVLQCTPESLLP